MRRRRKRPGIGRTRVPPRHIQRASFGNKKRTRLGSSCFRNGERCTETFDAVSDMKARLCGVVDWLFENPDYDPKPKVIPKEKYPVLVDVTF